MKSAALEFALPISFVMFYSLFLLSLAGSTIGTEMSTSTFTFFCK